MGGRSLPASECGRRPDMGEIIRYLGSKTDVTDYGPLVSTQLHYLRRSGQYDYAYCR
jgi:hypothetical protein